MTGAAAHHGERGLSLIEVVVLVAIVALIAGVGYETLAQRPAQARTSAAAFAGLVSEARALAAITAAPGAAEGSGASIGIVRDGDWYIATLYAYRPMRSARQAPAPARSAPLRMTTKIAIVQAEQLVEPPFALFFSTAGHASVQAPYTVGVDVPLALEPDCPLRTGIIVAFIDGVHNEGHTLSCESAQLDLDASFPVTPVE